MNIESYGFTVVTTVLGMLVVFLSLTLLSLLMVALKAAFAERAGGDDRAAGRTRTGGAAVTAGKSEPGAAGAGGLRAVDRKGGPRPSARPGAEEERQAPPWLAAAVAAYLAGAEREGPSAEPWLPEFNHFDPWLTPGRSTRSRGVGTKEQ